MATANIATTRNELSRLLRRVKRGETIVITERDRPVARLQPIDPAEAPGESDLGPLIASGALLAPARSGFDVRAFLSRPRPKLGRSTSLAKAVRDEREEGR